MQLTASANSSGVGGGPASRAGTRATAIDSVTRPDHKTGHEADHHTRRDRHAQDLIDGVSSLLRAVRGIEHRQRWPEEVGLRRADASMLRVLARCGELRSGELAAELRVDASVVSRQLSALEAAGLVTRRPDPDDARVSLSALSPAGQERLDALYEIFTAHLRAALWDLSDDDLSAAGRLLHRVADAVAGPAPAAAPRVPTQA